MSVFVSKKPELRTVPVLSFDGACNLSLDPSLYEPEMVRAAIEVLERDRTIYHKEAVRLQHTLAGYAAIRNCQRITVMINKCKKAL